MNLVRIVLRYEWNIWKSLFRWIFRRGYTGFGYDKAVAPIFWAFIVVSAVEVVAVHLLIPWQTARLVGLVLGIWSLVWMVGLLAAQKVNPHSVGAQAIHIRHGFTMSGEIALSNVESVRQKTRLYEKSAALHADGDAISVAIFSQTNIDIVLREPVRLRKVKGETEPFREIRIFADDPSALVTQLTQKMLPSGSASTTQ